MRKQIAALIAAGVMLVGGAVFTANSAMATTTGAQGACRTGWYVNPDETADSPEQVPQGFRFEGKDLIHHATTPIDLPDIKSHTGSFEATVAGKVVFKMETSNPYSTIIQNADGKFWSTAMTYDQEGGQGHPVENVSDLIGKPTKPGKAQFGEASKVVTFGVGYWVEEGSTIVTSITFHGTKYELSCTPVIAKKPKVTPATCEKAGELVLPKVTGVKYEAGEIKDGKVTVTATAEDGYKLTDKTKWTLTIPAQLPADSDECKEPTPTPTQTEPTATPTVTATATATPSQSQTAVPAPSTSNAGNDSGNLPVTGPGGGPVKALSMFGIGGLLVAIGGAGIFWARRRRDAEAVESA